MSTNLEITDDIAVLSLGDDENRFTPELLESVNGFLDRVEVGEAKAPVTTAAESSTPMGSTSIGLPHMVIGATGTCTRCISCSPGC